MSDRALKIELVAFDVDGVLTDGGILLTDGGEQIKVFCVRDGTGLKYLLRAGLQVAMITGRTSRAVEHRAAELGIEYVFQGAKDKIEPYEALLKMTALRDEQVAYVGDDLPDIPILRRCGLGFAVADAAAEVKKVAHRLTAAPGGRGAAREVAEYVLRAQGKWTKILARYGL
jgi:3-deoxy-D-manno-octulosonate 8-phosphate phosphatase (KDO 8-P phosphatase)